MLTLAKKWIQDYYNIDLSITTFYYNNDVSFHVEEIIHVILYVLYNKHFTIAIKNIGTVEGSPKEHVKGTGSLQGLE